jgi:Ca2+-binding EF-hand superfamily protein
MVSSVSSNTSMMMMRRPDPAQMAGKLFDKLDTKQQGYLELSDLQSAFDGLSTSSGSSSVEDVFSQLDGDSDGKVTKDELTSSLQALAEQLDSQFAQQRMRGSDGGGGPSGMQGMPPPPPPGDDAGFSKDELSQQLEEIGSSDSTRASLIDKIVNNFDAADSDGDGKVSFKEAMAYDQSSGNPTASSGNTGGADSTQANSEAQVMMKIMQLLHAYASPTSESQTGSALSVSA